MARPDEAKESGPAAVVTDAFVNNLEPVAIVSLHILSFNSSKLKERSVSEQRTRSWPRSPRTLRQAPRLRH